MAGAPVGGGSTETDATASEVLEPSPEDGQGAPDDTLSASQRTVEPGDPGPWHRRLVDLVDRHPLIVIAVLCGIVASAQAWWIWTHRHLGGFDPDETSYLSSALRIHRSIDATNPLGAIRAALTNGHGVTVPVLSVPLLIVGPRDVRMAMMVQPLLLVFLGVATAGITRQLTRCADLPGRLRHHAPAVFAALWVVLLPTVRTATQSYWYGLGAAAALAGAVWALLTSEGGTNRRIWWFGVGMGVMLLSRTMTLGYIPACAVAAVIVAWPDRRGLRRSIGAFGLGLLIAAPWYLLNRGAIFGYLLDFGYGKGAPLFGPNRFSDRLDLRTSRMTEGLFGNLPAAVLAAVAAVALLGLALTLVERRRNPDTPWGLRPRPLLAVAGIVAAGTAALLSTANNGVWFELPMVVLCVPMIVALMSQAPRPAWMATAVAVVAVQIVALGYGLWLSPWEPDRRPASHYEWGFSEYDERFAPSRRAEHAAAARDWWELSRRVKDELKAIAPDGRSAIFVMVGNTHLYNANTVRMAAELDPWDPILIVPDTTEPPAERQRHLTPTLAVRAGSASERVLVVAQHDQIMWPLDADTPSFFAQARREGFTVTDRIEMPRGGDVLILRQEP